MDAHTPARPVEAASRQAAASAPPDEQARLLRLEREIRELREQALGAAPDAAGWERLHDIHARATQAIGEALDGRLVAGLDELGRPAADTDPDPAEVREAQARLVDWLGGLLRSLQAAVLAERLRRHHEAASDDRGR